MLHNLTIAQLWEVIFGLWEWSTKRAIEVYLVFYCLEKAFATFLGGGVQGKLQGFLDLIDQVQIIVFFGIS